jgi:hypothetical protein
MTARRAEEPGRRVRHLGLGRNSRREPAGQQRQSIGDPVTTEQREVRVRVVVLERDLVVEPALAHVGRVRRADAQEAPRADGSA